MEKSDIHTLEEAKQYLRDRMYGDGTACPCCKQHVKMYKRTITSSMCWALAEFYAGNGQEFAHANNYFKAQDHLPESLRGDFAKFKHWMIIEADEDHRGFWRVTDVGKSFVVDGLEVPKWFAIYNDEIFKQGDEMITIEQASKDTFDLDKVLHQRAPQSDKDPL